MKVKNKTKPELLNELTVTQQRLDVLLSAEAARKRAKDALRNSKEKYNPLIGFVKRQCRLIVDENIVVPENIEDLLTFLINIPLPEASKLGIENIEAYNRLALKALRAA